MRGASPPKDGGGRKRFAGGARSGRHDSTVCCDILVLSYRSVRTSPLSFPRVTSVRMYSGHVLLQLERQLFVTVTCRPSSHRTSKDARAKGERRVGWLCLVLDTHHTLETLPDRSRILKSSSYVFVRLHTSIPYWAWASVPSRFFRGVGGQLPGRHRHSHHDHARFGGGV